MKNEEGGEDTLREEGGGYVGLFTLLHKIDGM